LSSTNHERKVIREGGKHLIETLHAFGIYASYTEVRQFLTSAANHEIAKTEVSCIPYGISPKTLDSDFIQEGVLLSHGLRHWSKTVSLQCKKHKYQMHEWFQLNV
jgi:hypothetical protein